MSKPAVAWHKPSSGEELTVDLHPLEGLLVQLVVLIVSPQRCRRLCLDPSSIRNPLLLLFVSRVVRVEVVVRSNVVALRVVVVEIVSDGPPVLVRVTESDSQTRHTGLRPSWQSSTAGASE